MTEAERRMALEGVAREVRACTACRLHQGRTQAVPGGGHPSTEVLFVGEGPGYNEDRQGRPFVGAAGAFLAELLGSVGWGRDEVFITNVVKCRPPDNRDPEPDEIAACAPFLRRQVEALDPALIVTLGRHSMGRFMPGARIGQVHGTTRPADPETGARGAQVFAVFGLNDEVLDEYFTGTTTRTGGSGLETIASDVSIRHALAFVPNQGSLRQTLLDDMAHVPAALVAAREGRESMAALTPGSTPRADAPEASDAAADPAAVATTPATPPAPSVPGGPGPSGTADADTGAAQATIF